MTPTLPPCLELVLTSSMRRRFRIRRCAIRRAQLSAVSILKCLRDPQDRVLDKDSLLRLRPRSPNFVHPEPQVLCLEACIPGDSFLVLDGLLNAASFAGGLADSSDCQGGVPMSSSFCAECDDCSVMLDVPCPGRDSPNASVCEVRSTTSPTVHANPTDEPASSSSVASKTPGCLKDEDAECSLGAEDLFNEGLPTAQELPALDSEEEDAEGDDEQDSARQVWDLLGRKTIRALDQLENIGSLAVGLLLKHIVDAVSRQRPDIVNSFAEPRLLPETAANILLANWMKHQLWRLLRDHYVTLVQMLADDAVEILDEILVPHADSDDGQNSHVSAGVEAGAGGQPTAPLGTDERITDTDTVSCDGNHQMLMRRAIRFIADFECDSEVERVMLSMSEQSLAKFFADERDMRSKFHKLPHEMRKPRLLLLLHELCNEQWW